MLVLLGPFFVVIAIIMKLSERGPVFFSQTRSGLGGKKFTIYKFRTMRIDRKHDPFEYVSADHGDITRLGRLLRRVKFDETPQVWNVLKGDMSLIGPRPTVPEQVVKYNDFERRRLEVRPGCTGLAQIHGGITLSWPEKIKWDVYYVDHLGPMMDLRIFFKTFIVVLGGDKKFTRTIDQANPER
jgi:lipopolysaccharide/colanic/teichoic acid biosynthesis glycosyltransferase